MFIAKFRKKLYRLDYNSLIYNSIIKFKLNIQHKTTIFIIYYIIKHRIYCHHDK